MFLPFLGEPGPALAQSVARGPAHGPLAPLPKPMAMPVALIECTGARASFAALVHPKRMTTFEFQSEVIQAISPSSALIVNRQNNQVIVQPRHGRTSAYGNLRVETKTCEAYIDLRLAARLEDAPVLFDIRQRDEVALRMRALDKRERALDAQKRALDEQKRALDDDKRDLKRATTEMMDATAQNLLLNDRRLKPVMVEIARDSDLASVTLGYGRWFGGDTFYFPIKIHYGGTKPFLAERIEVVDAAGSALDATLIGMGPPAMARHGIIAALQPDERATGVIRLSRMARSGFAGLTIRLVEATGLQPIVAMAQRWEISPPYEPIYPGEDEAKERQRLRQEREEREREREEREKGKLSLHLLGMYGVLWLQDGQDLGRSDATSTKGLGARLTYAFNRTFAFETEIMGASSGASRFDGIRYNGTQGDLLRDALLGRILGGAVVRFGSGSVVPLVRGGLGLQGGSVDSRFFVSQREVAGPGSSSVFDIALYFGGGADVRLGPVDAGFRLSVVRTSSLAPEPAIEAALHLGYSWKP